MKELPESSDPNRLLELRTIISGICDGDPDASQSARFEELCNDPACALYYVKAMQTHAALSRHFGAHLVCGAATLIDQWKEDDAVFWGDAFSLAVGSARKPTNRKDETKPIPSSKFSAVPLFIRRVASGVHASSVCAVLLIAMLVYGSFGIVVWQMSRYRQANYADNQSGSLAEREQSLSQLTDGEPVARLISSTGCRWNVDATVVSKNQMIGPGPLDLVVGKAVLEFKTGARVTLEGPSQFKLISSNSGYLDSGKLFAQVPKQAVGFAIETPSAKVIDMGTEFGVDVDRHGVAEVHVFRGFVVAEYGRAKSGAAPLRMELRKSEAARFTGQRADSAASEVSANDSGEAIAVSVPLNRERYANLHEKPKPTAVITAAEGNSGKHYQIVPHGLTEDALVYIDRTYQWNGIDAAGIPPELIGADYVETSNDDDLDPDFELRIALAVPATLYVFFDSRVTDIPKWLQRDFENTGLIIGIDDDYNSPLFNGAGKGVDLRYTVWKRRVAAGVVTLGATDRKGVGHYGVAAVADANE